VYEDGPPLGGAVHHIRFTRTQGAVSAQDFERAGLLAKRLGLAVELADSFGQAATAANTLPCRGWVSR
jgi:hypothetical protein